MLLRDMPRHHFSMVLLVVLLSLSLSFFVFESLCLSVCLSLSLCVSLSLCLSVSVSPSLSAALFVLSGISAVFSGAPARASNAE